MDRLILIRNKDVVKNAQRGKLYFNDKLLCHTMENHEKRMATGTYEMGLRKEGGYHGKYSKRYSNIHEGMLEIKGVYDGDRLRKYLLIHCANFPHELKGCIAPGKKGSATSVVHSGNTYRKIYPLLLEATKKGLELTIIE